MMVKYVHITYGLGRIYDSEMGAWREPMTEDEVQHVRRLNEWVKKSFAEPQGTYSDGHTL